MSDDKIEIELTKKQYEKNLEAFNQRLIKLICSQSKKIKFDDCMSICFYALFSIMIRCGKTTKEIKEVVSYCAKLAKDNHKEGEE